MLVSASFDPRWSLLYPVSRERCGFSASVYPCRSAPGLLVRSVNRFNFLYVTNKCCQETESWNAVTHPRGWRLTVQIVFFSPYFRRSVSDNCGRLALVRDVTHTRRVRKLIRVMKSLRPFFSPRSVFCFSWRLVTWILHRGEKPGQIQKITMIIK